MANVTIRLIVNKATGKKDVMISYASDEDALPIEHEDAHRAVVEKLIEGGALRAADLGQIVISRGEPAPAEVEAEPTTALPEEQRRLATNKG